MIIAGGASRRVMSVLTVHFVSAGAVALFHSQFENSNGARSALRQASL